MLSQEELAVWLEPMPGNNFYNFNVIILSVFLIVEML